MFDMYYVNQTVRVVRQWSDSLTPYRSQSSSLYVVLCHGYSKEYMFAFKYRTISKYDGFMPIWALMRENLTPVKYFTDHSKVVLLLWIFFVFSVWCLLCLCAHLFICALWSPAGKGLTSWLSLVESNYEFVTFPLVSWVRCGT